MNGISISNAFVLGASLDGPVVASGRAGAFLAITAQNRDGCSDQRAGPASSVTITGGSVNLPSQELVDMSGPVPQVVLARPGRPAPGRQASRSA